MEAVAAGALHARALSTDRGEVRDGPVAEAHVPRIHKHERLEDISDEVADGELQFVVLHCVVQYNLKIPST